MSWNWSGLGLGTFLDEGHHFFWTQISCYFFIAQRFSNAEASSDATSRHLDHQRQMIQVGYTHIIYDDCMPYSVYVNL